MRILFLIFFLFLTVNGHCDSEVTITGRTGNGHIIQDEGNSLRPRPYLNFTGSGVTCTDTGGKTVCNIPSGSGGGGGSAIAIKVGGSTISSSIDTLTFSSDFTGTESPTGTVNVSSNTWTRSSPNIKLINSTDNVGIGSATPGAKLDVNGTVRILSGGLLGIGTSFGNPGISVMVGNIGIGTWNPTANLFIGANTGTNSSAINAGNISLVDSTAGTTAINITAGALTTGRAILANCSSPGLVNECVLINNSNALNSVPALRVGQVGTGPSIVTTAGNVGISTSFPQQTLDIWGTLRSMHSFVVNSNGNIGIGSISPSAWLDVTGTITPFPSTVSQGVWTSTTVPLVGSTSSAVMVGHYNNLITSGTGSLTGAGHTISGLSYNYHNGSGSMGLQIGAEGVLQNNSTGTVSNGAMVAANMNNMAAGATYTLLAGFQSQISNIAAGANIGTLTDFYSPDFSGTANIPAMRYSLFNIDPSKNIYSAGNIGLGDITPAVKLSVSGDMKITGNIGIGTTAVNAPLEIYAAAPTIQLESNSAAGYITFDSNTDLRHWRFGSSNSGEAIFGVANKFFIYDANAFAMRTVWDGNGNVGIGSVNPGTKIDIAGDARMTGFNMPTGASSGYVLTSNSVGIGTWAASSSGSGSGTVNSGTAGQVAFYPSSTTAVNGTSALFIDGSGNVGFGSAVPGSKLDVNGTARVFGNIGIGTASPGQAVDIIGSARISGTLLFNSSVAINDQNSVVMSKILGTDGSARNYFAMNGTLHNSSAMTTGLLVTSSTGTAGNGNIIGISGKAIPAHTSGTNSNVYGVFGQNQINGSGGTTTNSFGVWGTTALITAGTLTNNYAGGFSGPVVVTGGNVGIGTLLPGQDLDVQGSIRATSLGIVGGAGSVGSVKTGANTVCTTTCGTSKCLLGEDTSVVGTIVGCSDATADICVCLGP